MVRGFTERDLEQFAHAAELDAQEREAEPLKYFRLMSWAQEEWTRRMYVEGLNTYLHGGNGSAKTWGGTFTDLAACTGTASVTGYYRVCADHGSFDPRQHPISCPKCGVLLTDRTISLPVIKPPVAWAVGVESYKKFAGSGLPAIRYLLGKRPYVEIRQGNRSTVAQFLIRHNLSRSKDEPDETWSSLFVFPYDGDPPESVRLDGYRLDEPPPMHFIEAFRTRKKAGRPMRQGLTVTPLDRNLWEPILAQYPAQLLTEERGRYRIQTSVYDNTAMTAKDLAEIEVNMAGLPETVRRARLYGHHEDFSGSNPFMRHIEVLNRWEDRCVPGAVENFRLEREVDAENSRRLAWVSVEIETWEKPDPGDYYFVVCDVGKGIRDGKHDPDCAHVWSRRKKKLVARMNDYVGGYGLGHVCAMLAQRYGNAPIHPAVTGGYGEAVLNGIRSANYHYIAREKKEIKPGKWSTRLGFWESLSSNNEWKEAAERALALDSVTILSRDVVKCLKNLTVDENGKVLGAGSNHDEDWVCAGRAMYLFGERDERAAMRAPEGALSKLQMMVARQKAQGTRVLERW